MELYIILATLEKLEQWNHKSPLCQTINEISSFQKETIVFSNNGILFLRIINIRQHISTSLEQLYKPPGC